MKEFYFNYNGIESWLSQEGFKFDENFILTIANSLIKMFLQTSKKSNLSVFDGNILKYAGKNALISILCKNLTPLKLENFCHPDICLDTNIAKALLKNNTLTYLKIYFSRLNSKFWNSFTYYLCTNSSLKFLILLDFNIGFEDRKNWRMLYETTIL
ncbi:hypothetical protein F8M41_017617 [Gigaspora margarita]|uniref:Uncharacterized protein n=1 Tax=Gigaspora margarita TaxID=4874 RepID=A0A8H4AMV3_GIGMA|nr:hypothetical protein F8M41_017617 [Gigaspora margarita]